MKNLLRFIFFDNLTNKLHDFYVIFIFTTVYHYTCKLYFQFPIRFFRSQIHNDSREKFIHHTYIQRSSYKQWLEMNLPVSTTDSMQSIQTSNQVAIFNRFLNNHQHTIDSVTC